MKFSIDSESDGNIINGYTEGKIVVAGQVFTRSVIILPDRVVGDWPVSQFQQLNEEAFAQLKSLEPDLVILGTGKLQRFPHPSLYRPLIEAHIGLEVMTTPAACRTYNVLTSENRRVAAALIIDNS